MTRWPVSRSALGWLEWRSLRAALPITVGLTAAAGFFAGATMKTLGPTACGGWAVSIGQPYHVSVDLAGFWFGSVGALLIPAVGAWAGSRFRQDEAFLTLAPLSPWAVFRARLTSGLSLVLLAVACSGIVLALQGLNTVDWWLERDLWASYGAALGLLWLRGVATLAVAAALRRWLSPVLSLLGALGLSVGLGFVWQAGGAGGARFIADPFLLQFQALYSRETFQPVAQTGLDCAAMQNFVATHTPDALLSAPDPARLTVAVLATAILLGLAAWRWSPGHRSHAVSASK
ncbi:MULTISPECIES: hypothetical protein [Deinococcus]|uniref:ABC transporter permease n=1 Tax=Deinococcus rufus TaxID=2136097 RepID=A0ABV7Z3C3_9DEIO|nr:hypothetical protein [Deinococcus sp. AB2017081]WQE96096.1 hypothetical protein U2P90_04170 [Deinococcus sp. AB2017081]